MALSCHTSSKSSWPFWPRRPGSMLSMLSVGSAMRLELSVRQRYKGTSIHPSIHPSFSGRVSLLPRENGAGFSSFSARSIHRQVGRTWSSERWGFLSQAGFGHESRVPTGSCPVLQTWNEATLDPNQLLHVCEGSKCLRSAECLRSSTPSPPTPPPTQAGQLVLFFK